MDSPWHERQEIIAYLGAEASDEVVEHAEKVASEVILGTRHDVWDVHTDKQRWWVVTNMTNLYSQDDFKSMDGVLTFHIGLMQRLLARETTEAPASDDERQQLLAVWREWEQAAVAQEEAREAQEFQAVGVPCRETLLSFTHTIASPGLIPEGETVPKRSDFIHWAERVADSVAPGTKQSRLRGYLKSVAKETWEYVSHVTHRRDATAFDGQLAVRFTGHLLASFSLAIRRAEAGLPERCPRCASYRVTTHWEWDEEADEALNLRLCEVCDWEEEYEPEPLVAPPPENTAPFEGDCLPSSEL
jgi:hypothetical protein